MGAWLGATPGFFQILLVKTAAQLETQDDCHSRSVHTVRYPDCYISDSQIFQMWMKNSIILWNSEQSPQEQQSPSDFRQQLVYIS